MNLIHDMSCKIKCLNVTSFFILSLKGSVVPKWGDVISNKFIPEKMPVVVVEVKCHRNFSLTVKVKCHKNVNLTVKVLSLLHEELWALLPLSLQQLFHWRRQTCCIVTTACCGCLAARVGTFVDVGARRSWWKHEGHGGGGGGRTGGWRFPAPSHVHRGLCEGRNRGWWLTLWHQDEFDKILQMPFAKWIFDAVMQQILHDG